MYHSCFPQLIAGPIVRYEEIEDSVRRRTIDLDGLYQGTVRFIVGLGKKCIFADNLGLVANQAFGTNPGYLGAPLAWVGIVAYTLQIYFDFAGYSDMAIGLGRILGFTYPENFNQPYRSRSVTEFWRRWHMTLSRWFRDYLYIPLGGNRAILARTLANLFIVFLLCGLWHGAAYTFIVWGMLHGSLLVVERLCVRWTGFAPHGWLGWAYTVFAVMMSWVFFRAETFSGAVAYLRILFLGNDAVPPLTNLFIVLPRDKAFYMVLGILVAIFPFEALKTERMNRTAYLSLEAAFCTVLLVFSAMQLSVNGFTPFIYFRF
jgi:alginate O-acetyltransferase complex protein AlgI